jgi:sporulation protein YlmC with PRC-barrel domain
MDGGELEDLTNAPVYKLLVSGWFRTEGETATAEVRRGMSIQTRDGLEVGLVAAVLLDCRTGEVRQMVLSPIPPTGLYRLVAPQLVTRCSHGAIRIDADLADVASFPLYGID